jgi:hypothetical protein
LAVTGATDSASVVVAVASAAAEAVAIATGAPTAHTAASAATRAVRRFLDALIGSDMHFETAGSLWGGRRVWVLARVVDEDLGKAARANRERTIGRVLDVFSGRGSAGDATGDSQRGSRGG